MSIKVRGCLNFVEGIFTSNLFIYLWVDQFLSIRRHKISIWRHKSQAFQTHSKQILKPKYGLCYFNPHQPTTFMRWKCCLLMSAAYIQVHFRLDFKQYELWSDCAPGVHIYCNIGHQSTTHIKVATTKIVTGRKKFFGNMYFNCQPENVCWCPTRCNFLV